MNLWRLFEMRRNGNALETENSDSDKDHFREVTKMIGGR